MTNSELQIIPAAPGFEVITFLMEDREQDPKRKRDPETFDIKGALWRESVIAWRIDAKWYPEPITIHHVINTAYEAGKIRDGDYISAILDPAGAVTEQHNRTFRNLDAWIDHVRDEWRQWRAKNPPPTTPGTKLRLAFAKESA